MLFPVAGEANPIYRERVYCYELYHQLRVATGDDFGYSLGGEVDKVRHPILSKFALDKTKPDLLVHKSGDMRGNLVVMEVKPVNAKTEGIKKDLQNLTSFVRVTCPLQTRPDSELGFSRIRERRQDGRQTIYS